MNRKKLTFILIALSIFISIPIMTQAYSLWGWGGVSYVKWSSNNVRIRAAALSFPSGNSYRTALDSCIYSINNQNPSPFQFNLTFDEPSVGRGNGENEIWFSSDNSVLDGAPAITYAWRNGNTLTEADIIFDNRVSYTSGTAKNTLLEYGGAYRPFRTTALHELGHAMGLAHVATLYNIMGTDWTHIHVNSSYANPYFGEDASNGLVALYGNVSPAREDVGVVHWRHIGNSGEYSTHGRTRIFSQNGVELTKVAGQNEPRYYVDNGQRIQLEFTYENNGSTTKDVEVRYYISTNDSISMLDREIGRTTLTLGRNVPYTAVVTLDLPSDLDINTNYYIGAVMNTNFAFVESFYANNATYTGIRTTSYQVPTPTPTPTLGIIIRPTMIIIRPTEILIRPTPTPIKIIPIQTFIIPDLNIPTATPMPYPEFNAPISVQTFILPAVLATPTLTPTMGLPAKITPTPTPTMGLPTKITPTPIPISRIEEPKPVQQFLFNESSVSDAGLTEIPGGFQPGTPSGESEIGSIPTDSDPSVTDGHGVRIQCAPGEVMLLLAQTPITTGQNPVIIRLYAQANSPEGQFALVAFDGSFDGSLATVVPSKTEHLVGEYKRISILYEPTQTETVALAIQLNTPATASGPVEVYLDNIEVIPFTPNTMIGPDFVRME